MACSVALLSAERILGEYTLNAGKTHSQRLMPLIDALLRDCQAEREDLGGIAAASGPGSFTGIRIGVSTARALAQGLAIPAVAVSTLEALSEAVPLPGALICPLLDARRKQVYTALYRRETRVPYGLAEVIPPSVVDLPDLLNRLASCTELIIFVGEGLAVYAGEISRYLQEQALVAAAPLRYNRAGLVALRGQRLLLNNPVSSLENLLPGYLRQPEAVRRLEERKSRLEQQM